MSQYPIHPRLELPLALAELILVAAEKMAKESQKAFRIAGSRTGGRTLRPGKETPLWNALRAQLRPHLRRRGTQVNLARVLGLPRQRINAFITAGSQMPDAERTLQLLAWLIAARDDKRPA
jgi:hypothetical protein